MTLKKSSLSAILIATFLALTSGLARAEEDPSSAAWVLPGCKLIVDPSASADVYRLGLCVGTLNGLNWSFMLFCPPDPHTSEQMVRVVLNYVEQHPERIHENFEVLAIQALQLAWPCPTAPPIDAERARPSRSMLMITWVIAGQPPRSYQTPFTTTEACQKARGAVLAEGARLNGESERKMADVEKLVSNLAAGLIRTGMEPNQALVAARQRYQMHLAPQPRSQVSAVCVVQ
jgi:hypothetical protein